MKMKKNLFLYINLFSILRIKERKKMPSYCSQTGGRRKHRGHRGSKKRHHKKRHTKKSHTRRSSRRSHKKSSPIFFF